MTVVASTRAAISRPKGLQLRTVRLAGCVDLCPKGMFFFMFQMAFVASALAATSRLKDLKLRTVRLAGCVENSVNMCVVATFCFVYQIVPRSSPRRSQGNILGTFGYHFD